MVGAKYRDTSGYLLKWLSNPEGRGVACVGGGDLDSIWGWSQLAWPEGLLTQKQDEKGNCFGSKSATLGAVGHLIPLIIFTDFVAGKQLVFNPLTPK